MITRTLLLKTDPREWRVQQVIAWDWHDGPREGVCQFSNPACTVFFRVKAEQWLLGKFGDRLYSLQGVPDGTLSRVLLLFGTPVAPRTPIWAPHGDFENDAERVQLEEGIAKIVADADMETLICRSRDLENFDEVWLPLKE